MKNEPEYHINKKFNAFNVLNTRPFDFDFYGERMPFF